MADPLSIASGIIALLTASGHTAQGLNQVWGLRHRSQELLGFSNQLNALNALLGSTAVALRQIKAEDNGSEEIQSCITQIDGLVGNASMVFDEVKRSLQETMPKKGTGPSNKPSKRTWLRRKSKITQMTARVSALINSLTAALTILQGLQACSNTKQASDKVDVVLSRIEAISRRPNQTNTDASLHVQVRNVLQELQKAKQDDYRLNQTPMTQASHNTLSRRSSTESFHSAFSSSSDSSGTLVSVSGIVDGSNDCEAFCPCHCHTNSQSKMPWWATQLFGSITLHGNGSVLLNRQPCNKKICRQSGSTRIQVTYMAPAWTFLQFFKILITSESLGRAGPSLNVRLTNTVPNDATIWSMIELGKVARIREMLHKGEASPHDVSPRGVSLLKYAVIKGQNEVCAALLVYKADPYYRDHLGIMAIQAGIDRCLSGTDLDRNITGAGKTSHDLFLNSESLEQQGFTILHLIVLGLHSLDLEMVLRHYPVDIDTPDANGRSPLLWASWRGDLSNVALLLKYGADIDKSDNQSWTPLARASKAGHIEVVQYLLMAEPRASQTIPTAQGFQPIHHASDNKFNGHAIVDLLLAHGADPNAYSTFHGTPLHNAANRGSVATIKTLLAHGSDINATDSDGDTPAMISLLCWNEAAFFHLAASGARLDICRKSGLSLVHVAVWTASVQVWYLLTAYGESGKIQDVDIGIPHKGHGIHTCFEKCRDLWYVGTRDIAVEKVKFGNLLYAFKQCIIGPQPLARVDSVLS